MSATQKYLNLCREEEWKLGRFRHARCEGDSVVLVPGAFRGEVCLRPVDSAESGFQWSRVKIKAGIPRDADIRIYARASDNSEWPAWPELCGEDDRRDLSEFFGPSVGTGEDILLAQTGRYLWLALELIAGGSEGPRIECVSVRMGGDHMVDYLPSIYQGQDFTYRYLSIFNSLFQDMEQDIDDLPRKLEIGSTDEEMLSFLARWLCVGQEGGAGRLRALLPDVLDDWETMYTVEGIRRSARMLTGKEPYIVEPFAVDPNDPQCRDPELYRRLYGEKPYRFFLLFPQDTFSTQRDMERFINRMRDRIPAGTEMELVLLKPGVQLDCHTYLGVNSRIESYTTASIRENMTMNYDTMIGGPNHEQ